MAANHFDITQTTRGALPRVSFSHIKEEILGKQYELSLVLIGDTLARRLSIEHKKKPTHTNILSFPLSENEGEIFINLRRAERDAKRFGQTPTEHIAFLFIHGCLHLKGREHGEAMEKKEEALFRKLILKK